MDQWNTCSTPIDDISLQPRNIDITATFTFLEELGTEGLCKIITTTNRKATATVVFGLFDGENLSMYESSIDGTVAEKPRGTNGFGWDPIFIPNGYKKTHGEMTIEEMDEINIRKIALEKMEKSINK